MKVKNNLICVSIIMLIMIIAFIVGMITIIVMAFEIHTLIGILVLCAVVYYIGKKVLAIL